MPDKRWKATERRIAALLSGRRVPVSGGYSPCAGAGIGVLPTGGPNTPRRWCGPREDREEVTQSCSVALGGVQAVWRVEGDGAGRGRALQVIRG